MAKIEERRRRYIGFKSSGQEEIWLLPERNVSQEVEKEKQLCLDK